MRRVSFAGHECPVARGADAVGDVWSLLILRDVFDGYSRFDELQSGLGIAPSMLARRLTSLVDAGLLERRRYQVNPPRDQYVPTQKAGTSARSCWRCSRPATASSPRRTGRCC
jgi:DNA-binding HxlR family transcriptional regulator